MSVPDQIAEVAVRAALGAVLSIDRPWMTALLSKFEDLQFLPDAKKRGPCLHAKQRSGTGEIRIEFSNGGRTLKITALFDAELSTTTTYRLPREYRLKVGALGEVAQRDAANG